MRPPLRRGRKLTPPITRRYDTWRQHRALNRRK
jgi:hypothetical protein